MAVCNDASNYAGRKVIVGFAISCGDEDPATLNYLPVGSSNQKDINVGTTTSDNTNDDTFGVQSAIVTFLTFSATVSGFATQADSIGSNQALLKKYLVNEVIAGRQPNVFVKAQFPDVTYYAYCSVTENSNGAATADNVTYSFTFTATATPVGSGIAPLQIFDTPVGP